MPLELKPMVLADLKHFEAIATEAFANTLQTIFYPNGVSAEAEAASIASAEKQWAASEAKALETGHEPALRFMKVIDTELGPDAPHDGIVGVAKWNIYAHGRSEEELCKEEEEGQNAFDGSEGNEAPPGLNIEAVKAFKKALRETKRNFFGTKPYMILQVLVTLPSHFRRGVGAMHLQWGQDVADRLNVPLYLESSPMGRPLYKRWGYCDKGDIPFDAREWGAADPLTLFAMIRPTPFAKTAVAEEQRHVGEITMNGSRPNGSLSNGHSVDGRSMNGSVNGVVSKDSFTNGHSMNRDAIAARA